MASIGFVAVIVGGAGKAISAIAQANALRGEARARQVEGEQELLSQKRRLRQELGLAAVRVGASGLLGGSFSEVFESQAIEDAEFLGRIKQRTDFDVQNLKRQSKIVLATGLIGAGAQAAGGIARGLGTRAEVQALERAAQRETIIRDQQRRGQRSGNIFSTGSVKAGLFAPRRARTATFF